MQLDLRTRRAVRRTAARAATVAAVAVLSGGCASDPWQHERFDRLDRVWVGAGDAQARNIRIHAVNPIPEPEHRPRPRYDGQRILAVMNSYRAGDGGPDEAAPDGGTAEPQVALGSMP